MSTLSKYKGRTLVMELIAQQSNDLSHKLTALFTELFKHDTFGGAQNSKEQKEIVELTKKYTGLKINFILDTDKEPCTFSPIANTRHVLDYWLVDDAAIDSTYEFRDLVNKSKIKKGTVDLKKGRVGGVYSETVTPLYMNFMFCKRVFTPREAAAIYMHEVGHTFLAFEMMYRTVRASQLLAGLHQVRTNRDSDITYEHALELVGRDLTGNPKEFIECVTMKNDTAVSTVVFGRVYHKLATDFGEYSVTGANYEALADNFAAKWGFGTDLTMALYKFDTETGLSRAGRLTNLAVYLAPLLSNIFIGTAVGVAVSAITGVVTSGVILGALAAIYAFGLDVSTGGRADVEIMQATIHDKPIDRYKRLRDNVVHQMKDVKLDPQTRQDLLSQIKIFDTILKDAKQVSNIVEDLSKIFTSNRRADFAFKLERNIELLANNDLFVSAQRLASKV